MFQELLNVGTTVANLITRGQPGPAGPGDAEAARSLVERCRQMLRIMVDAQRLFDEVRPRVVLEGEHEFGDAVVELRDLIAELEGVVAGVAPALPASEQQRARFHEEFRKLAEAHPPPQSWFDEDFKALAGPGGT